MRRAMSDWQLAVGNRQLVVRGWRLEGRCQSLPRACRALMTADRLSKARHACPSCLRGRFDCMSVPWVPTCDAPPFAPDEPLSRGRATAGPVSGPGNARNTGVRAPPRLERGLGGRCSWPVPPTAWFGPAPTLPPTVGRYTAPGGCAPRAVAGRLRSIEPCVGATKPQPPPGSRRYQPSGLRR